MSLIEIMDGPGGTGSVITKVANSSDPDQDVIAYGGVSWRPFQKTEEQLTDDALAEKVVEIIEHRTETLDAAIDDARVAAETLYLLWDVFTASGATLDPKWQLAFDIWEYAKNKISLMNNSPRPDVEAYDPTTDPGWPS